MATILVVDDDDDIRGLFVELLGRVGHDVIEACDGADALRKAAARPPDLIISDLLMPGMDGFELVRLIRSSSMLEETAVIFYSATFAHQEALDLARACGAVYLLQKPCRSEVLLRTVTEALKAPALARAIRLDQAEFHHSHLSLLTNTLREKVAELADANRHLAVAYDATLEGWVRALDLRDRETQGHSQRVSRVTVQLARAVGFDDADLVHVRRGALLHDIGKLAVSDLLLLKPGPLTAPEREAMEKHPGLAHDMLQPIDYLRQALDIPYCHHERWDGSGYPRGLRGEAIPLSARLFAVVDVWDALSSQRPYRTAWSAPEVNDYLIKQQGTQFDPHAVEEFLSRPELASCEPRPAVSVRPPLILAGMPAIPEKPVRQNPAHDGDGLGLGVLP